MDATADRGLCPVCSRSIGLKKDGTLRHHTHIPFGAYGPAVDCDGSGQKPKEA